MERTNVRVARPGVGVAESVTAMVTVYVPLTFGFPVMNPVRRFRCSPRGSDPFVTVYR